MYATILWCGIAVFGQTQTADGRWTWFGKGLDMAHAQAVWDNSDADGDWDNVNNWSGGVVPVNGANTYDVIFDPAVTTTAPSVNLAQAADEVNSILFMPGWTAGIGASGSPLEIMIDSDSAPTGGDLFRGLTVQGSGDYYYKCPVAGSANVLRDAPSNGGRGGTLYLDGDIRNLLMRGGNVQVIASATLENRVFMHGNQSYLVLAAGSTLNDLILVQRGGRCEIRGDLAADSEVHVTAGTCAVYGAVRTKFYAWGGTIAMMQQDTLNVSSYFALGGIITFAGSRYTPDLNDWVIDPDGHVTWHANFWEDPGQAGQLCADLREQRP